MVELAVVVAIIGLLASIAIPNYTEFSSKAKQSEAQGELYYLYGSEQAFSSQWGTYTSSFYVLGLAPTGYQVYRWGFNYSSAHYATTMSNGLPPDYAGPISVKDDMNSNYYCSSYPAECTCQCYFELPMVGVTSASTFTAGAIGYLGNANVPDSWMIDQNKVITQISNGIP